MNTVLNALVNALLQVILFSLIPFVFWFIWQRKKVGFPDYIGLKRPERTANWWIILLLFASYFAIYFGGHVLFLSHALQALNDSSSVSANQYAGLGTAAIVPAFFNTFIQNGFCEELLFRGFLCKRLMKWLGKPAGIIAQACIFALIHNVMFLNVVPDLAFHIVLFGTVSAQAALMAIINEKAFDGSIWPSVLIHGIGNFLTTMLVVF